MIVANFFGLAVVDVSWGVLVVQVWRKRCQV